MNALEELVAILNENGYNLNNILYGKMRIDGRIDKYEFEVFSPEDCIKYLSFKYDNGYGGQYLFGYIVLKDRTWLERQEYDGSEWWEHKTTPETPFDGKLLKELKEIADFISEHKCTKAMRFIEGQITILERSGKCTHEGRTKI